MLDVIKRWLIKIDYIDLIFIFVFTIKVLMLLCFMIYHKFEKCWQFFYLLYSTFFCIFFLALFFHSFEFSELLIFFFFNFFIIQNNLQVLFSLYFLFLILKVEIVHNFYHYLYPNYSIKFYDFFIILKIV